MRVTLNRLGVPPCWRAYFLLLRQKKVAKEKATPSCAVGCANSPALLETGGGCGTRATPSDSPRPFSATFSVARRSTRGPKGGVAEPESPRMVCYGQPGKKRKNEIATNSRVPALLLPLTRGRPGGGCLSGPLRGAEQRRNAGGSRLALSEPQASLASRPAFRVAQGTRLRRAPTQGWPFLWLLSFGHTKESTPARKAEPQANYEAQSSTTKPC